MKMYSFESLKRLYGYPKEWLFGPIDKMPFPWEVTIISPSSASHNNTPDYILATNEIDEDVGKLNLFRLLRNLDAIEPIDRAVRKCKDGKLRYKKL